MSATTIEPFRHATRVYWEDTDAGGIVYYANYLRFFERARTEWLRGLGVDQRELRERDGAIFVVSEAVLRYHRPARLDDLLEVTVAVREAARASLSLRQRALRGTELLAEGEIRIACVEAPTLKLRRIPPHILSHLQ
ncbi:MAG: tol-pal system-associated acyl-CoA thioesterase [Ideonella sp.]|nr:tol-pal system-associated acyl-CoA thioesterase [Ideonella sp.]MCC7457416.1 tol-pal system-associated acyl-CoA thioesterase [Nitrospira sp.]